jgi:predicted dehydrogenase
MPSPLPVTAPVKLAVVGLGQITELMLPAYADNPGIEVVGLCDLNPSRRERWASVFPTAHLAADLDDLLGTAPDVVDVLVPTPHHAAVASRVLEAGFHVQVQKPIARDLEGADRMLAAARASGARLCVLEDYLGYPPLVRLRDLVRAGEIGDPVGCHMKIVATGRGGWEVPAESYDWQFEQALDGRGMLVFDHGWHQLAVATWLFGPVRRIFAWLGETEIVPGIVMDAPSTLVWEHHNGVRVVLEITFAIDTFFRSSHYGGDERVEVTGTKGYVRCNRISAQGIEEPSVLLYREGETRGFHSLDDRPPDAFRAMAANTVATFTEGAAPLLEAADARHVLVALLAALESHRIGSPVDVEDARS